MNYNILREQIIAILPKKYIRLFSSERQMGMLREIRIRANRQVILNYDDEIYFTDIIASKEDILSCIQNASGSSIYAFVDEIKNGFITLKGGHRIGICGRAVIKRGEINNIVDFSGLNIRIAKEILGCAKETINLIGKKSALLISPPGCGKTTMLRDIARILGEKNNVSIVDERGEIAACYKGEPQFDVGQMTDVLDLCPKKEGIEIVLRGMSPQYIITDEIGKDDISSINKGLLCGVSFIVSAHGDDIRETVKRLSFTDTAEKFGSIILLGKNGIVKNYMSGSEFCERR